MDIGESTFREQNSIGNWNDSIQSTARSKTDKPSMVIPNSGGSHERPGTVTPRSPTVNLEMDR